MSTRGKNPKTEVNLGKEVVTLAHQVVAAIKDSAVRDEVKGISKEALSGLRTAGGRIVKALQKAKDSEAARDIKNQTERVLEIGKSRGEKQVENLRTNLAKNLHHIGKELQDLAQNLHKK